MIIKKDVTLTVVPLSRLSDKQTNVTQLNSDLQNCSDLKINNGKVF